ncbi:hypothetical protein [Companilactobacillus kimchiensis]|uniref:Surface layer protein A domain-containing protein n=1 Tax=Companilactobacillus kimchiensis TaxID=993692 RepID=A0A0R2LL26_9LACO|nr:hypothetical protein [Companilactobacillus kimchiensis]KRO00194.1 hypothetical protein IV57_GL001845 [Companilactobacillus kimchiensis]
MKKLTSILLSGLFISGMVFSGGMTTTATNIMAADTSTTTDQADQVTNTVVFKDLYGKTVGSGKVMGNAVGDAIDLKMLDSIKPKDSYVYLETPLFFKADGSSQSVTDYPEGMNHFYGVVRINDKTEHSFGAPFYPFAGVDNLEFAPTNYGLPNGTEWKVFEISVVDDNDYYYRVDNTDWISAKDMTLISTTPITADNSMRKSDRSIITTKNHIAFLTNLDGKQVYDRALAPNTPWYTDKMALINGVKMYRVSTNEWVKESDLTYKVA